MKKLLLDLDALDVQSFTTAGHAPPAGTVRGYGTFRGSTCGAENTCGPQTCGDLYCVIETGDPLACGGGGTGGTGTACPSAACATANGALSCVGCTTQDYTVNLADDTCGFCQSFGSDVPQRCPCP
ncbi:MAG TPA: hypothetical protein VF771_09360 [Longimicrobiaceae bacterium]